MHEQRPWTNKERAAAEEMRLAGATRKQIADKLERTVESVRSMLNRARVNVPKAPAWTREEDAIVLAHPFKTSWRVTAAKVSALGTERTALACRKRRQYVLDGGRRPVREIALRSDGWLDLPGTQEERDAEFVSMVLRGWAELQGWQVAA